MEKSRMNSVCSNSNSSKSGFTLLEVLITITLALLVVTAVYSALFFTSKTTAEGRTSIVKKQVLMKHFYEMRRQLINLYNPGNGIILLGREGTSERAGELYFVTATLNNSQGVGEVGYKIEKDVRGNPYLAYTEFPYPRIDRRFAVNNPADEWKLASNVIKGFEVEYEVSGLWVKSWNKDEAPEKMKITFWYQERDEESELAPFSFIVVPGIQSVY